MVIISENVFIWSAKINGAYAACRGKTLLLFGNELSHKETFKSLYEILA